MRKRNQDKRRSTPEQVTAAQNNMSHHAPIRLGIISNPFSRRNARSHITDRLLPRLMPDPSTVVNTHNIDALDEAIQFLLFERNVNVLGLNGGDGTLHAAINRLMALKKKTEEEFSLSLPLPKLLFLNGGTLNIVSRATGTKGNTLRTVKTFLKRTRGECFGQLKTQELRLIRVHKEKEDVKYGFVFGTEVVANALEMYGLFGEGYTGLMRLLSEVTIGYQLHSRLWQEHGWKLDPPTTPISIDQVTFPQYCATVAATIDLSLIKGVLSAIEVQPNSTGIYTKCILETDPGRLIGMIPRLMTGRSHEKIQDFPEATHIQAFGGYTLDGECFLDRTSVDQPSPLLIDQAPTPIHAVRLE